MSEVRDRIVETIQSSPGIHFNALVRTLDLAPGQVQYHSRRLQSVGAIVSDHRWGRTHYFPPGIDAAERKAIAVVRRETAGSILQLLLYEGPMSPGDLADELTIARSTLEYHLQRLESVDLVRKESVLDGRVQLSVADRRRAARLSSIVDPSFTDRLTDRFERLLDQLTGSP